MPVRRVGRITFKMNEIGLVGTASHNLARYSIGVSLTYTPEEFKEALIDLMQKHDAEQEQIDAWMSNIEKKAKEEEGFFKKYGEFADSNGGTSMTVAALFTPMLEGMGYMKREER